MSCTSCREQIHRKGGAYCNDLEPGFCASIWYEVMEFCGHTGLPPGTPMVARLPDGRICNCCCGCLTDHAPVEVAPGKYRSLRQVMKGDPVLTTGPDLSAWAPRPVSAVNGTAGLAVDFMWLVALRSSEGPATPSQYLLLTADHLLLGADGRLHAAQDLRPGAQLRRADGETAEVLFAWPGQYSGEVIHVAVGDFQPEAPLDGHLINMSGLVMADLSLQLAAYSGRLDRELLGATPATGPAPGTAEFLGAHESPDLREFLAQQGDWPTGFVPALRSDS